MRCDVDVGNTRVKWRFSVANAELKSSVSAKDMVADCIASGVTEVCISSVVGAERWALDWQGLSGKNVKLNWARVVDGFDGLRLAYTNTEALGVDRWLAMVAARRHAVGDLVVISAGTAITVDFVLSDGEHLGGFIVAGVARSANALCEGAHGVGVGEIGMVKNWQPGRTTLQCVESGYSALYQGFLANSLRWADAQMNLPTIIITGGDAPLLRVLIDPAYPLKEVSSLVLDGLSSVFP